MQLRLKHIVQPQSGYRAGVGHNEFIKSFCKKWNGTEGDPEENYPDRKSGYPIGIYTTTVQDMYEPLSNSCKITVCVQTIDG